MKRKRLGILKALEFKAICWWRGREKVMEPWERVGSSADESRNYDGMIREFKRGDEDGKGERDDQNK